MTKMRNFYKGTPKALGREQMASKPAQRYIYSWQSQPFQQLSQLFFNHFFTHAHIPGRSI